jgi:C4-dicarboxylate-specific signal transduction histidine kinase
MKAECAEVDVRIEVNPASLEAFADSTLLDQVLVNLVKNALEAMSGRPESKLKLGGRFEFGRVLIFVSDNGPGIDDETADEIFVPFFTTKREGSGIGLSLCRQIMTAHGGDIVIASDSNGTTANIIL